MRTRRLGFMALMAVGLVVGWAGAGVADNAGGLPLCQANLATCTTSLATCTEDLAAAQEFPATGQTTCYDSSNVATDCANTSGQDGNIRAGATLSYSDNGDGTITDNNTGLMWEKKDDNNTGGIHDKDAFYTWADAFAVHIAGLNTANFAGHTDWRLPNVKELQSIINYQNFTPAVSSAFNTVCAASCTTVLTPCSCTEASLYWSSSTIAIGPSNAWLVNFTHGFVLSANKSNNNLVRAVRGGL